MGNNNSRDHSTLDTQLAISNSILQDHFTKKEKEQMEPLLNAEHLAKKDTSEQMQNSMYLYLFMLGTNPFLAISFGKTRNWGPGKKLAVIGGLTLFDTVWLASSAIGSLQENSKKHGVENFRNAINPELVKAYQAIRISEWRERSRAIEKNTPFIVEESRLRRLNLEINDINEKSPIQQAVQDSYITMEELQRNRDLERNNQNPENQDDWQKAYQPPDYQSQAQDQYQSNNNDYYSYGRGENSNTPQEDDFARQVREAELANARWKKKKWDD